MCARKKDAENFVSQHCGLILFCLSLVFYVVDDIRITPKFEDLSLYDVNVRSLMRQDPLLGQLSCLTCGKGYATARSLSNHIENAHLQIMDYKCQYCNKTYKNRSHRAVHIHREHRAEHKENMEARKKAKEEQQL